MSMTREEAIRFLERYVGNLYYTPQCQAAHRMAIEALKGQEERRWIPVTERLPDRELDEYRKRYEDADLEVLVMIKGASEPTTLFYNEEGEFYGVFEDGETVFYVVTHWMPMPGISEEESE